MRYSAVYLGLFLFLSSLLMVPSPVAGESETLVLNPIADSHVEADNPNENYGGQNWMEVCNYRKTYSYGYVSDYCAIVYIMFDLSEVESDWTVNSATLSLRTFMVFATRKVGVRYCSDNSWKENEITWNNKPDYGDVTGSYVSVAKDGTWYNWTVTSDVKKASSEKITWVLKIDDSQDKISSTDFYSRDREYYSPKLIINYTPPSTAIPSGGGSTLVGGVILLLIIGVPAYFLYKRRKKKDVPPTPSMVSKYCPKCGAPLSPDNLFCERCGATI